MARLVPGRNEASVAIIDGVARYRPETLSGFDISGNDQLIERAVAETADKGGSVIGTSVTEDGALRYIAIPISMGGDESTGVYLRAIDLDAELEAVDTSILTYSIAALATLAATGIVGWFVVGRMLSPIRRLQETADSITLTELGARIPTGGNDDISDVTRTVNSMLDRLEGSVDVQRQLLDDVRHELKTPDHDRARPPRDDGPRRRRRRRGHARHRHRRARPDDPARRRHRHAGHRGGRSASPW